MHKQSIVVSSDWHIGNGFNRQKFKSFLAKLNEIKPDEIILAGDIIDAASCSKFTQKPGTPLLAQELKEERKVLEELRVYTDAPILLMGGNHEFRIERLILEKAPGLHGIIDLAQLLRLGELDITYRPNKGIDNFIRRGEFLIGHFYAVRGDAGMTAISLMKKYGTGIIQGHVHRLATVGLRLHGRQLWGAESGCMCDLDPDYISMPNWANGFIWVKDGFPQAIPL